MNRAWPSCTLIGDCVCGAVCMLQCVAVWCSMLQCVSLVERCMAFIYSDWCLCVCCSMYVAVYCSVLI